MNALPTLRRKILQSFSLVVGLYAVLGMLLAISVNVASETTPTILHINYDSIQAAAQMKQAWSALQFPGYSATGDESSWIRQFQDAMNFEAHNISEPGEQELSDAIQAAWKAARPNLGHLPSAQFQSMIQYLDKLVVMNERGMFGLAQENLRLNHRVMIGTLIYFLVSLILSILFADNLAERLSRPLKSIAESLHRRTPFNRRLKLPEPRHLEMLILTTELKRLWERLGEAEKVNVAELVDQKTKLETLLESVEDGLLVLGADDVVLHCNDCLATLVELPKEQIQHKKWSDLSTISENYAKLRSTLRPGMPESQQVELNWKGANAYFSARSRRIGLDHGQGAGFLYLLHDITEKKQREKFRAEFIDMLSHELKTPLQSLGTASELLKGRKQNLPEDLTLLVDTISEDVERIRAVAQEFVQITQSQNKIMKLKMERVSLSQAIPEWIKPFGVVAKDRGVKIDFEQEGSEVIWASLDPVKFPWVISNILSNAVRFSPPNGVVTVRLTDRRGAVEIQVLDQGPGIPEAEQNRVFEPFYQSAMTTSSGARGLFGIGLTIAKEVVEAHDGRIEYYRLQPRGSEFRILLPFPPLGFRGTGDTSAETKSWTH